MQIDPQHSLQLAFQHLDAFGIPGVGTFRRAYYSAVIDHQKKKIMPPGEKFVFEKKVTQVAQLEDFFFRFHDLSIGRAKELVNEVAEFIQTETQKAGKLLLPGVGELRGAGGIDFNLLPATDGAPSDAYFGLLPLNYTLGDTKQPTREEKTAAAAAGVAANTTVVEPAPRKRKRRPWLIVLLLVLLLGSTAGMIWQDEFVGILEKIGLVASSSGTDSTGIAATDGADSTSTQPGDSSALAATDGNDMEPAIVDPVRPADRDRPDPDGKQYGSYAASGQYYLIIHAGYDGAEANRIARNAGGKVLRPRGRGFYKVSAYNNADKMKVIEKMVALKSKYSTSWIYWRGMQ